ncbi:hypothetical protein U1Q18_028530, partial [Sarracenia purpurea var. burkii]
DADSGAPWLVMRWVNVEAMKMDDDAVVDGRYHRRLWVATGIRVWDLPHVIHDLHQVEKKIVLQRDRILNQIVGTRLEEEDGA